MMDNSNQPTLEFNSLPAKLGDAYLKLQLEDKVKSILPLAQIKEVALIPIEQVTFIPSMAKCILGLVYRRNRVIWIVDLPQILNLTPIDCQTDRYQVAIAHHENMALGLVVPQIQEVIRLSQEEINLLDREELCADREHLVESTTVEPTNSPELAHGQVKITSDNQSNIIKPYISESLMPYLSGWIRQSEETLMLLNTKAILNAPILHQK